MADILNYTGLVTSEHNQRPKFMATVAAVCQGLVDIQNVAAQFPTLFDLDKAVGDQLDKLGQLIGASRQIPTPLTGVYFSWGTANQGWGQGTWFNPQDSVSGLVTLPDDSYRILLKAVVASNAWDGTVPGAYSVWSVVFALEPFQLLIQDNQDMTMNIILLTNNADAVALALINNGYIAVRPAGVKISSYNQVSAPVFGWGANTSTVQGWGLGNWI